MGQPRPKARPRLEEDARPSPGPRSWQAPPDGLFDVIVPRLTAKQFVVVQLVCKEWSRAARACLKQATPRRPDVDLGKLAALYPNLTQLNLSFVEGLTTRMLTPLRKLTALRELCLPNVSLRQFAAEPADDADAAAGAGSGPGGGAGGAGRPRSRARAPSSAATTVDGSGSAGGGVDAGAVSPARGLPPLPPRRSPAAARQATVRGGAAGATSGAAAGRADAMAGPSAQWRHGCGPAADAGASSGAATRGAGSSQPHEARPVHVTDGVAGAALAAQHEAQQPPVQDAGGGAAAVAAGRPGARLPGGLGDVLAQLSKLQADLCPALTADAIASLPRLTDLTVDTLVAPEALAPLPGLRSLTVKRMANSDALDRLTALTSLHINSDTSCASDFLPVCARLHELRSLAFKTSCTKVVQQPDTSCWQQFSRLSALDLRVPAECLKPGLPALAALPGLRSLSLDLYCGGEEELMATVVAPPNLESLFVSADRSRSGGVIDVHPNARLRCLRLRLYWTALNLVLPEGLPEPSPLPEPLSDELREPPTLYDSSLPHHGPTAAAAAAGGVPYGPARHRPTTVAAAADPGASPDADAMEAEEEGDRARRSGGSGGGGSSGVETDSDASPRRRTRRRPRGADGGGGNAGAVAEQPGCRDGGGKGGSPGLHPGGAAGPGPSSVACHERLGRRRSGSPPPGGASPGAGARRRGGRRRSGAAGDAGADSDVSGGEAAAAAAAGASGAGLELERGADAPRRQASPNTKAGEQGEQPGAAAGSGGGGATAADGAAGTPAAPGGAGAAAAGAGGSPVRTPVSGRGARLRGPGCGGGGAAGGCGGCYACSAAGGGGGGGYGGPELCLEELCLDACFFLLYGNLVPLLRQFPALRRLTLDNSLALENGELAQLCELGALREVSLSGLHLVTDAGLRALGKLARLEALRVKGLRKLAVHAVQAYMRQKPIVRKYEEISGSFLPYLSGLHDLRSLALKHLHTAREGALAAGLQAITQLTRLEIKDVHCMSDAVLASLARHTALNDLAVLHCERVTAHGRAALVRCLGPRVALDLEGCSLPDITRPCALPTTSTQAQLLGDDTASSSNQPRRSAQHSTGNAHA